MVSKSILIKKNMWDLVITEPQPQWENHQIWAKEVKKNRIIMEIIWQIILKNVRNQITFNIIRLEDLEEMWDKLTNIYTKISQRIVYSILQKLLNYPTINKLKGYDKVVIQIFAEVQYLCKHFQITITLKQNLWDIITIVISLNLLHNNFDSITTTLLESRDKAIDQIQNIS